MKVQVPFVFEAEVIHTGCRKARTEIIADIAYVEIPELAKLKLAASVDDVDYYFDGESFYKPVDPVASETGIAVACGFDEWSSKIADNLSNDTPVSKHLLARYREAIRQFDSQWTPAKIDAEKPFREYLSDNREQEMELVREALADYAIYSGRVVRKTDEPVYVINTFGMGRNHGGTGLFIQSSSMATLACNRESIFNLSQLDKAIKRAESIAINRGDDKSVPMRPNSKVSLYLPEAFRFDPFSRDELEKGDISLAEYLSHNGEITHKAALLIEQMAANLAHRVKHSEIEDQVAWLQDQSVDPQTIMKAFAGD